LPIGGSRRVDRGPTDLGPIYMARKRAADISIRVCVSRVLVVSIAGIPKSRVEKCGRTESKCNGRTIERGTRT
ncbi:hypothetical protein T08_3656, partial [Trichinella sp. T8]